MKGTSGGSAESYWSMDSCLHLLPITGPVPGPCDIYSTGTALLIPLGAGLVTGIRQSGADGIRCLTTDDLVVRDTTVGGLWADAALEMLAALGRLTAAHGTSLRRRRLGAGFHEVGVIDDLFPAAGLIAHPLLLRPTLRVLRGGPVVTTTESGRLLVAEPGCQLPPSGQLSALLGGEACGPALRLTAGALL